MKIPFDIKYRPQIESGEYSVETRNGLPVRIVCWDRKYGYPIVGLAYEKETGCESYVSAYEDGTTSANGKMELSDDLFIVTKEDAEDERTRKGIIDFIKFAFEDGSSLLPGSCTTKEEALTYLEKQKPVEWSEDDKMSLNGCICTLHSYGCITYADFLKRLPERFKLQSQWKPSEGQMKALEFFIRSWGESGTMSPQNPMLCAAKTLLNDLKVL